MPATLVHNVMATHSVWCQQCECRPWPGCDSTHPPWLLESQPGRLNVVVQPSLCVVVAVSAPWVHSFVIGSTVLCVYRWDRLGQGAV